MLKTCVPHEADGGCFKHAVRTLRARAVQCLRFAMPASRRCLFVKRMAESIAHFAGAGKTKVCVWLMGKLIEQSAIGVRESIGRLGADEGRTMLNVVLLFPLTMKELP
jgi:hypothetical protein